MYTTSEIKKNSQIIQVSCYFSSCFILITKIDLSLLITVEMGEKCPLGKQIRQSSPPPHFISPKHTYLAIYIIWDRYESLLHYLADFFLSRNGDHVSHHQEYYQTLGLTSDTPNFGPDLSSSPIFWNDEDLCLLLGSHLLIQIEDRKVSLYISLFSIISRPISQKIMPN